MSIRFQIGRDNNNNNKTQNTKTKIKPHRQPHLILTVSISFDTGDLIIQKSHGKVNSKEKSIE